MFADYLAGYTPGVHKVLNMITLECSATLFLVTSRHPR